MKWVLTVFWMMVAYAAKELEHRQFRRARCEATEIVSPDGLRVRMRVDPESLARPTARCRVLDAARGRLAPLGDPMTIGDRTVLAVTCLGWARRHRRALVGWSLAWAAAWVLGSLGVRVVLSEKWLRRSQFRWSQQ